MKKGTFFNAALVILPLTAVAAASMTNAVSYYYQQTGESVSMTYFSLAEGVPAAVCLPLAAILSALAFGLAVLYVVTKKPYWAKGLLCVAFVSMFFATVPILVRTDVLVIPNVWHPIAMGVECLLAHLAQKKGAASLLGEGKRISDKRK